MTKRALFTKSVAFAALTLVGQWLIAGQDRPPEAERLASILAHPVDVIMFGDSSFTNVAEKDVDRRPLHSMITVDLSGLRVAVMAHAANHAGVYASMADAIIRSGNLPRAIVAPINLRSFSPEWDLKPSYQFVDEMVYLSHSTTIGRILHRPAEVFKYYDVNPISWSQYRNATVFDGTKAVGRVAEFDNPSFEELSPAHSRGKFILHYMYQLTPEHRRLQSLRHMAEALARAGVHLILFVSPLDMEAGQKSLGADFGTRVQQNIAVIRSALVSTGAELIDLVAVVPDDDFDYVNYPTEHLKGAGRRQVANRVAGAVRAAVLGRRVGDR